MELHGSVVPEARHEIRDVDVDRHCARFAGDAQQPRGWHVVQERVGDASANDDRGTVAGSTENLPVDDDSKLAVTSNDAIPDEVGKMVVSSGQTTSGSVSESRLMVPRRPRTWTRRRDRSTPVTRDHGITGYLRPTSLRTATTT